MKRVFPPLFVLVLIALFTFLLTNTDEQNENVIEAKGVVISVDNSEVVNTGIGRIGFQLAEVMLTGSRFKGERVTAINNLLGQMEMDEFYEPGDKLITALLVQNGEIRDAKTINRYRQGWELGLFGVFVVLLIVYARFIGLKALLSFVASLYILWKIFIPGLLGGGEPIFYTVVTLSLLTFVIIFSVAGFTKKGVAAFLGTITGLAAAIAVTVFFGSRLGLMGMTQPFAQTLVLSGHMDLDMLRIFYASVIIGASGAAMDIAMDVAASMDEIKAKRPDIAMKELILSGFNVGRAVVGTMTTTLLLAYSGGYLTLIMLFVSRETSFMRIMNFKLVAAEVFRTLTGSIGLVLVAPVTALIAGWILTMAGADKEEIESAETDS
ncbi:YibE/F family protein [Limisalsivibrio acetivorans]|uniref:YibE/F family protein n=1 Tax=Limisalsivibrio acetivorans TaxID=1304888 RepID=UPI0003B6EF2A|nr:YibE/F family protein [Limisalsivibrio acetivorans]